MKKNDTKIFIEKAKIVHGDKYDYSKVCYINNMTKVCIICPEHGEFWQTPGNHLSGINCPKCAHRSYKKTNDEFVSEARKIHGDKYDYSKVEYVNNNTKVCIVCPEHGEFWQKPTDHLNGHGCQKCYDEKRGQSRKKSTEEFVNDLKKIVHSEKYDFSKVEYVNTHTKVCIICPEHGEFWKTPNHLLERKSMCPKCSRKIAGLKNILTTDEFIKKAKKVHGNRYDYSKVEYFGAKKDVKIICPVHGEFLQKPNYHLSGNGCPKCKISRLEDDILLELERYKIEYIFHSHPDFLNGLELDFFLPKYNIAIECQGRQHYRPINFFGGANGYKETHNRDILKWSLCKKHGIKLLYYTKEDVCENDTYCNIQEIIKNIMICEE